MKSIMHHTIAQHDKIESPMDSNSHLYYLQQHQHPHQLMQRGWKKRMEMKMTHVRSSSPPLLLRPWRLQPVLRLRLPPQPFKSEVIS